MCHPCWLFITTYIEPYNYLYYFKTTTLIIPALLLNVAVDAVAHHSHDKSESRHEKPPKHPTCQEFTQGLSFNDSQAIGSWHLLHYKSEKTKGSGDSHCIQFSAVNEQVRTVFAYWTFNFEYWEESKHRQKDRYSIIGK